VTAVTCTRRGDRLASGGEDMTIRLWETVSGEETGRLRGHTGAVTALAFGPDPRWLASGGWDRSARLWDVSTGQFRELAGIGGGIRAVAFSPDGRDLLVGGGKTVKAWDASTGRLRRSVATLSTAVLAADLTPDGATLAVGGADGLIRLFDTASGTEQSHLTAHRGPVVSLAFGPEGRMLVSSGAGASVAIRPTPPSRQGTDAAPEVPAPVDPEKVWADLAGDVRSALAAQRALAADPAAVVALLRDRLKPVEKATPPSSADVLRGLRAVDWLARIGGPEARAVLESLAGGAPNAAVTDAAAAALARLG
jgi:hypothetical protein